MQDGNLKAQATTEPDRGRTSVAGLDSRLKQQPCLIGAQGFCCKLCTMGPCRVINDGRRSACGASRDLIVAKNLLRFAVGGTAAHICHTLRLLRFDNLSEEESPPDNYIREKAPAYLYRMWREAGILPADRNNGHLADMAEALHMTTLGVNADYGALLTDTLRIGLIDGYYGLHLGTELEERRLGAPSVREGVVNLGTIRPDRINIAVHGHEPMLADCLARETARYREINLVGVCCTGSYLLARYGVPLAAHFPLQEEVIRTGLVEAMVVDVQCIMPSLSDLCECHHTALVSTNEAAGFPGATHLPVTDRSSALAAARRIIEIALQNRENRQAETGDVGSGLIHDRQYAVVGHSELSVPVMEIAEGIRRRSVKGVIGVVGCAHPRTDCEEWVNAYRELSGEFYILSTGCMAFEFARHGLMDGRRFFHLGSCINNARIAKTLLRISKRLDTTINGLPFLISAPAPVTEKAMAISLFFAAFGCSIHSGFPYLLTGAPDIARLLDGLVAKITGAKVYLEDNPHVFMERVRSDFR